MDWEVNYSYHWGTLVGHAALNIDGNFTLDVYEAGEPVQLVVDKPW